jgi:hypothetical protein
MTKYPAGNVKRPPPGRASRAGDNRRGAFKVRSHSPSPVSITRRSPPGFPSCGRRGKETGGLRQVPTAIVDGGCHTACAQTTIRSFRPAGQVSTAPLM